MHSLSNSGYQLVLYNLGHLESQIARVKLLKMLYEKDKAFLVDFLKRLSNTNCINSLNNLFTFKNRIFFSKRFLFYFECSAWRFKTPILNYIVKRFSNIWRRKSTLWIHLKQLGRDNPNRNGDSRSVKETLWQNLWNWKTKICKYHIFGWASFSIFN